MKKEHVKLRAKDQKYLEDLLSKGSLKVRVQKRCMGLHMLDKGMSYQELSKHLHVGYGTLSKWAKRYKSEGLAMLYDKARSGRPISIRGEERAKVTALVCSEPPEGYARWSLRLLANRLVELEYIPSISHTEVAHILKKTNFNLTAKNKGVSQE